MSCQVVLSVRGPRIVWASAVIRGVFLIFRSMQINGPHYLAMKSYKVFSLRDIASKGPIVLQGTSCSFSTLGLISDRQMSLSRHGELHEGYE